MESTNQNKVSLQLTGRGKELEVRAEAAGGQARSETATPPETILTQMAARRPSTLSQATVDEIGETLYDALLIGEVGQLISHTIEEGRRCNEPVQIELRFDADQITMAKYPWELIRNNLGQYLVRDGVVDMTRCITYPQPMPRLREDLREISLLRLISQPPTLPPITAVELIIKNLETIAHATFPKFQKKLLIDRFASWALQFDGHGALILKCPQCNRINELEAKTCSHCKSSLLEAKQTGVLAFEHNGEVDFVTTEEFGSVLYNSGIQLALLLACETARVGNQIIFNGLAPRLILSGVPVVVGMQFPVLDSFANQFANTFYEVLIHSGNLLQAVGRARRMSMRGEWYSPALYMRYQPAERRDEETIFQSRSIDTATPATVEAGSTFLVRLWIRRPTTPAWTEDELRKGLGIREETTVITEVVETDIAFSKVGGRNLRLGELTVALESYGGEISPERIQLFVAEERDAPPAIFAVKATKVGVIPLVFRVFQDGGLIASISHQVEAMERGAPQHARISRYSGPVLVTRTGYDLLGQKFKGTGFDQLMHAIAPFWTRIEIRVIEGEKPGRGWEQSSPAAERVKVVGDSDSFRALPETLSELQPESPRSLVFSNCLGMSFVLLPAGTFLMGSSEEDWSYERQHQVTLSRPFYLQMTPVTQGQWRKVMGNNPAYFTEDGADRPVEQVSWDDAREFITKLNQMEGTETYRLPTEAEWEYACRAKSTGRFCFGDDETGLKDYAWYEKNSAGKTHPVGQKQPNAWGLYDMHGNVWEWCQDWYAEYPAGPVTDPQGPDTGEYRVLRGGSWYNGSRSLRSALRDHFVPDGRYDSVGFRVARTI